MFVVPVTGDKVKILGSDDELRVSSYTSLKSEPALYLREPLSDGSRAVYFSEIEKLNDVTVSYDSESKLLIAEGPIKRKYNLPQPGDSIVIKLVDTGFKEERITVEVKSLRLHSKQHSSNTLLVLSDDGQYSLSDIMDIDRAHGSEPFNRTMFTRYYLDYLPFTTKIQA